VRRFGARRNIRLGRLATLPDHVGPGPFDLIVCSDVLNYLAPAELARGLRHVRDLLGGVAYLELYTRDDEIMGDLQGYQRRSSVYYRRLLDRLKLTPCGPHCYAPPWVAEELPGHQRSDE